MYQLLKSFFIFLLCTQTVLHAAEHSSGAASSSAPSHAFKNKFHLTATEAISGVGAGTLIGCTLLGLYYLGCAGYDEYKKYLFSMDAEADSGESFDQIIVHPDMFFFAKTRLEQQVLLHLTSAQFRERIDRFNSYNRAHYPDAPNVDADLLGKIIVKKWGIGTWNPFFIYSQQCLDELAVNPFEDFEIGNYRSFIVRLISQANENDLLIGKWMSSNEQGEAKNLVALFQTVPKEQQIAYLHALLIMFGGDLETLQKTMTGKTADPFPGANLMASKIVAIAYRLGLHRDPVLREAFLGISDEHGAEEGMLYNLLYQAADDTYSMDSILEWFGQHDYEQNQYHMSRFLNAYPFESKAHIRRFYPAVQDDQQEMSEELVEGLRSRMEMREQKLRDLCNHIQFDFGNDIRPALRMVLNGTVNPVDTEKLTDFFARYDVEFKEEMSSELEEHRTEMFKMLIAHNETNSNCLRDIVAFLAENPHLFHSDEWRALCLTLLHQAGETIPLELLRAHLLSLKLNRFVRERKRANESKQSIEYCCLDVCAALAPAAREELFVHMKKDRRYSVFLEHSGTALNNYVEDYSDPRSEHIICSLLQLQPVASSSHVDVDPAGPARSWD